MKAKRRDWRWFFGLNKDDIRKICTERNTRVRTMKAILAHHDGMTQVGAARAYGVRKQDVYYWLDSTERYLKRRHEKN